MPGETRRALVIEDDGDIRELLVTALTQGGFAVESTGQGSAGVDMARRSLPDLVTLDLSLPDVDGIEVCREIRGFSDAYIVIITAKTEEVDRLIGLEVGADDYLTKPFSPRELRARVAAMFRRPRTRAEETEGPGSNEVLSHGELEVDLDAREARLSGEQLELTRIEFDLLTTLLSNPGRVWPRDTLLNRVWQTDWLGDTHLVDVHMANLRRKLGDNAQQARWIRTVRGVGYRLGPG
jgi:DNA-binding response OmpR family regulator